MNATATALTLDELIAEVVRICRDTGDMPSRVAAKVLDSPDVTTPEVLLELAAVGLAHRANEANHHSRAEAVRSSVGKTAKQKVGMVLRQLWLEGADGTGRYLIDFTIDDWLALADRSMKLATAERKRAAIAKSAAAAIGKRGGKRTRDLPAAELQALEGDVISAW